jgi:hypothetical protein
LILALIAFFFRMDSSLTLAYFTALHDEAFSLLVESRD